ncbi:MAG: MFS transporter [Actinobacteria bacterium]|nr:MFS transporter [Actinomycetota bacterium]
MDTNPDRRRSALIVASAGYFFVLLDVTIVNVALARIGSGLGTSRAELQWVVDAYALALAAFMLGAGDLADRLGSRRLFLAGLALFGLASAACAAAPGAAVLIAARVAQGLGAAAVLPTSLAIVNQLYPEPEERPRAIGLWAGVGSSALVLGPVLGGLLVGPLGWRAIFALNLPLVTASLIAGRRLLPAARPGPGPGTGADVPGQLLGTLALSALVFALIEGGGAGFGSAPVFAAAAVTLAAFTAFAAVERRQRRPLLDLRWFSRPEFSGANAGAGLMNLGTLGALFALSLYLQDERGLSPLAAGLNLVPLAAPLALLALLSGRLVTRVGPRLPAALGLLACGAGYLALSRLEGSIDGPAGWALLALAGSGMGVAVPGLVAGATAALGPDRAGIAAAVNNTSRQVGGAVGVALIGGYTSVGASLLASGLSLTLGGFVALLLMGGLRRFPRRAAPRGPRCPGARPRSRASAGAPR